MLPFAIKRIGDGSEKYLKWKQILDSPSNSIYTNTLLDQ